MKKQKISILVAARKNSKYLAKFIFGYLQNTQDLDGCEMLVMINEHDTWNRELVEYFIDDPRHNIRFFTEDLGLGRGGLHRYFNDLADRATGDWLIYFCDDHYIQMPGWDQYVRGVIDQKRLNPKDVWCIVPKFINVGAMNQMLSRGYVNALGGILGRHGNIDSYINDVNQEAFGVDPSRPEHLKNNRVVRLDDEMFYDFTHDKPTPLDDIHTKTELSPEASLLPLYSAPMVKRWIGEDALKIRRAL